MAAATVEASDGHRESSVLQIDDPGRRPTFCDQQIPGSDVLPNEKTADPVPSGRELGTQEANQRDPFDCGRRAIALRPIERLRRENERVSPRLSDESSSLISKNLLGFRASASGADWYRFREGNLRWRPSAVGRGRTEMHDRTRDPSALMAKRVYPSLTAILLSGVLLVGVASGCADSSSHMERPNPAQMVSSGSWYAREPWPHDGRPLKGKHFVVYSDGASVEARQQLADLAEEVLVEVVDEMGVDPEKMFRFPADQDKIDLYANRYHVLEGGGARAYYAGVIIWSFDSETGQDSTDVRKVRVTLKHELVHVVEALLKGRYVGDVAVGDPRRMPVWFSEGTAEALSGGSTGGAPRTLDEMNELIAEYGRINPIAWKVDLPPSEYVLRSYPNYYYPMAHLAVEYLLDTDGPDRSPKDLAAVMLDMGNDASFAEAFESHLGISESDYEAQFFARMDAYLPQSKFPIEAMGLGLGSLLVAGLMGGSLVWGLRQWPAVAAPTGVSGAAADGRPTRRGFLVEIWAVAVISVGFAVLLLVRIAVSDLPPYARRAPGYLTTAAYVVTSAGILMWAIRRRANHLRGAFLGPLLVLVATGFTIVVVEAIF